MFIDDKNNAMHRAIAGHNPYCLFILAIDSSKKFTTLILLAITHMAIFVVKSIYIQIYGQVMDLSIDLSPTVNIDHL